MLDIDMHSDDGKVVSVIVRLDDVDVIIWGDRERIEVYDNGENREIFEGTLPQMVRQLQRM